MPSLQNDIVGRVERLPLRPTPGNSLMPLYEAVSNGLHAIDDRFAADAPAKGIITIEVIRDEPETGVDGLGTVLGFGVQDNGIGLDADNYVSFQRPDSRHKVGRGGKGIGRLGWLKVFSHIRVDSTFRDGVVLASRSFDFRLADQDQIVPHDDRPGAPADLGTRITLQAFRSAFQGKCPVGTETILTRLASHFLPLVAAQTGVSIRLEDQGQVISLRDFFVQHVKLAEQQPVEIAVGGVTQQFTVTHLRVSKALKPQGSKVNNRLFLCANGRTADEGSLDSQLGLGLLDAEDVYVGCVSGAYLDDHVNAERTGFTLSEDELVELRRALLVPVNKFLDSYVTVMREAKRKTTQALMMEYPQFLFIRDELDTFVTKMAPGVAGKEAVFVEMARARYRRQTQVNRLEREIAGAADGKPAPNGSREKLQERIREYSAMVQTDQKGVLAEYVVRRKAVLDLLDTFSGYEDTEAQRQHREDALHGLICPMRKDSTQLDYEDHNLWLLDDRLAFFAYFNSDRQLRSYTDNGSLERPDIAFFYDTVSAWVGSQEASNTVVLVEFKHPNRNNYSGADNPVRQVGDYVEQLRNSNTIKHHKGSFRPAALRSASYHCYIVADLTETLLREIRDLPFQETPDRMGRFGYIGSGDRMAYVEIVPYEKLLRDAKLRNAIFFQKLGLTDLAPSGVPSDDVADNPVNDDAGVEMANAI